MLEFCIVMLIAITCIAVENYDRRRGYVRYKD